jgi:hypothetical protein
LSSSFSKRREGVTRISPGDLVIVTFYGLRGTADDYWIVVERDPMGCDEWKVIQLTSGHTRLVRSGWLQRVEK